MREISNEMCENLQQQVSYYLLTSFNVELVM